VTGFLRFFGLLNAAVWLGGVISFTFALGPAFFSKEMTAIIRVPYNGIAAQIIIHRFFILINCCGAIALLHLFLEKLYLGKMVERLTLVALLVAISLGLSGGFLLQPKLKKLHLQKYSAQVSTEIRTGAERSFRIWHGVSQTMNLFMLGGLLVYFWRISNPPGASRFSSAGKFRG
jgi:hypothetical protein